jgi:hypothetical protein
VTTVGAIEDTIAQLKTLGYTAEEMVCQQEANFRFVVLKQAAIPVGRLSGQVADIAVRLPRDFPLAGPTGLDTRPHLCKITGGKPSAIHNSSLGGEWAYWSRPCPEWAKTSKDAEAVLGWLWRVMKNAPAS